MIDDTDDGHALRQIEIPKREALTEEQRKAIHDETYRTALALLPKATMEHGLEGAMMAANGLLTASAQAISGVTIAASPQDATVVDFQPTVEASVRNLRQLISDMLVSTLRMLGRTP